MSNNKHLFKELLTGPQSFGFETLALEIFRFQAQENAVYRKYLQYLGIDPEAVFTLEKIPFLPIEFFKTQEVKTGKFEAETIFKSSGTTQQERSRHFVADLHFYLQNAERIFEQFYGKLTDFVFLALLPSYLEQGESSLVAMVDHFIKRSKQQEQGFFLNQFEELKNAIDNAQKTGKKVMLFGVTYALLDLAENMGNSDFANVIIMETGGMKGRRREMIREELHAILKAAFKVENIHSEYGMTELLSQAYSSGNGIFQAPKTMKILLRDLNDPFEINPNLRSGGMNVIDLANIDSCAFIETKDIGKLHPDGTFEVLGRFDNSDIRGCNLLVS
ncbi:acyl transferase [Adhaeribacter sp. BT258]|uniref:Acyl transferase n=1 Tax=Adhaeribacter terrigena TaxID=2793070 RepID=A0ABS1C5M3_9BACT|nr:acyl transferase [Adhaeribacter terrigena]MBK0403850.1 acyl transferase [Adhaeribacter terrigena]